MSYWNYREEAEILQNDFHVIIPILNGHAESDKEFNLLLCFDEIPIMETSDQHIGGYFYEENQVW